jgi:DNA polymerase
MPIESNAITAADFLPPERDIPHLAEASLQCRGCPLYAGPKQTVFGEGNARASLVMVGEAPGDIEDRQGRPFVGPAGKVLENALAEVGIPREEVYLTNAVKHFKFVMKGPRRIHQSPTMREINACKPWLEAELQALRPEAVVCLGVTAAKSIIDPKFTMREGRGRWLQSPWSRMIMATYHPSAILRMPEPELQKHMFREFMEDLNKAWTYARETALQPA